MSSWLNTSKAIDNILSAMVTSEPEYKLVLTARMMARRGASAVGLTLTSQEAAPSAAIAVAPTEAAPPSEVEGKTALPPAESIGFEWELPAASFIDGDECRVPGSLTEQLVESIHKLAERQHAGPLWLCLERPYGLLGLVPWEAELVTALDRPVLRLPEYPYRAAERPDAMENVMLVDPPGTPDQPCGITAPQLCARMHAMIGAILAGSSRCDTRIHIFPRLAWYDALQEFADKDTAVLLHDPREFMAGEAGSAPARPDSAVTPWTAWLLARMDRGIDGVHLLGRAALQDGEGCFLLSASPRGTSRQCDVELSVDDLVLLLNRAGAWSLSMAALSPGGARAVAFIADALAHRWQGAVLFARCDETAEELTQAMRLLYTVTSTQAPKLQCGFLYCHPDFVECSWDLMLRSLPPLLGNHAALLAMRAPLVERFVNHVARFLPGVENSLSSVPPSWVSATQRFLEKELFDDARRQSNDVLLSQLSARATRKLESVQIETAKQKLLSEVRDVVARYRAGHDQ
jgi:hypothetical protein